MAVKMRLIGGEWGAKMAPENGGIGTTLATSKVQVGNRIRRERKKKGRNGGSIRPHTDFNRKKDPIFEAIF